MLQAININQFYDSSHCLKDLSFSIADKQCLAVLGLNGAGKTTLAKTLMGIEPMRSGTLLLDDIDLGRLPSYRRVELGLGYVPQGREIFSGLTVEENLSIGERIGNNSPSRISRTEILEIFPVLREMRSRRGGDLSGGQQQQLSIARALMTGPSVLVLDEPTEGIQPSIVSDIRRLILELKGQFTIILIEQYIDFAKEVCDEFIVLTRGEIGAAGQASELNSNIEKQFLKG